MTVNNDSVPDPTTERAQTSEVQLAQPIESTHEHETADLANADREAEVVEWIRFDPFHSEGMRRLTLGTMGTGKTVSAMATASRVLDTVPDARIVVVNSVPGEYDPLAHALSEKNRTSETGDIPSAKRFRVGEGDTLSLSASDLPAVSIIEPPESAALPECQESLEQAVENVVGELSSADRQWPTYLVLDEAQYLFRPESAFGINELMQAQQEHGALAVQVVTPGLDGGRFEAAIGDDESVQSPLEEFTMFDLYYTLSDEQRKRFGLSSEEMRFLHEARPGGGSRATTVREAAPTGLCQTPDEDWQRVRYTLTEHEAETLLDSATPEENRAESANRHQRYRQEPGGI